MEPAYHPEPNHHPGLLFIFFMYFPEGLNA